MSLERLEDLIREDNKVRIMLIENMTLSSIKLPKRTGQRRDKLSE
jgi:hypothetical protein